MQTVWIAHEAVTVRRQSPEGISNTSGKLPDGDRYEKLLERILKGRSDANINFEDVCQLLRHLGFEERIRGSHHIFRRSGVEERINLQHDGSKAKPYQVGQLRRVILRYKLGDVE